VADDRGRTRTVWGAEQRSGPLVGLRVVDLGQYLAGPLCALLLADQGADVIRVDPPGGPRWDSPANAALLRGRRHVILDLHDDADRRRAADLIASADVVIENFRPGTAARLGVGPESLLARAPHLVYCSLPGFGTDDDRADLAAWEGVVMAAAAAYSLDVSASVIPGGGGAGSTPVFSPLPLASVFGALEGAMAVMAALLARNRDGLGQQVEVPLFDALFEAIGLRALSYERNAPAFTDFGSGFYHCAGGTYFTFIATWFHHLERFVEAAGVQSWIDDGVVDYDRLWADPETLRELQARLAALFATRPASEWEDLARSRGCTVGMLRSTREWMAEPQAVVSGTLVDIVDPVLGPVRVPGRAIRLSSSNGSLPLPRRAPGSDTAAVVAALDADPPSPPPPQGVPTSAGREPGAPPLAGFRVLDMSRVVAAPTAAKLLGQLGADVVKIDEDPEPARAAFRMPAMHEHLNRAKQTMVVDLKDGDGIELFRRLVAACDVLVHNFTVDVEERLGIDDTAVRRAAPDIVYLYLNTYGRQGPWANHRGFAELANITTGITERSMGETMPPTAASASMDYPRWTFTDYSAGVLGAFGALVALYDRSRTGQGQPVETSLVRATALEQILYLVHEGDARSEPRGTSTPGWGPLQRLYATADGPTVFVGAAPHELHAVTAALDVDLAGARADRAADLLERAIGARSCDEICAALREVGIGVHAVTSVRELMAPGGVAERRGLRLQDQTEAFGAVVMPGPVVRFGRTPMRPGAVPGPFGCDREAILERLVTTPQRPTRDQPRQHLRHEQRHEQGDA
jgi:crotonobetainyl-CoA:carnitine CoA-transferase CaiB-like acyl-CoA transferase